ncbi:hypothetical protein [Tardiphaga sp. 42S5]|uniref:hypothetical protein n=1 Tax=Tardiphaga sp. 42S5 TaxID=1404799 RepID=UPI002A5ABD83|nr:hypothetical protein [Tardiphaga sp. 42S5]WPO39206.1 hypothetical protein SFY93_16705 [Tardiphaga sp. 42S5]
MSKIVYTDRYVAFVDILGFSEIVRESAVMIRSEASYSIANHVPPLVLDDKVKG